MPVGYVDVEEQGIEWNNFSRSLDLAYRQMIGNIADMLLTFAGDLHIIQLAIRQYSGKTATVLIGW